MNKNTKEFLINNCRVFEKDGNLYQSKPRAGDKLITSFECTAKHKYGRDITYNYVLLYDYKTHKSVIYSLQQLIYIWFKGDIPKGYDVDHIDSDSLNNDLDNLQILSHGDNIRKRGVARNQYCCNKSDEEILMSREERQKHLDFISERLQRVLQAKEEGMNEINSIKATWHKLIDEKKELNDKIRTAKNLNDKNIWHSLIADRVVLEQQIREYNQKWKLKLKQLKTQLNIMRTEKP